MRFIGYFIYFGIINEYIKVFLENEIQKNLNNSSIFFQKNFKQIVKINFIPGKKKEKEKFEM